MKRIYICSPFRADSMNERRKYIAYARMLVIKALDSGAAPYAPHLYLPDVLNDGDADDREKGMAAGLSFLEACDEVWVGARYGISQGMQREIEHAEKADIHIRYLRKIAEGG